MKTITLSTAIIGTGAAGYNAALRLARTGDSNIAIFTMGVMNSTSRNTGSDKQTYYKLSLAGSAPDSPETMARDLFGGRCVDGDHALCEAALSAQCFYQLSELGVPFPVNRYGESVGYQTDHDVRGRATSAGPLTSKLMTECLSREVERLGVKVYDHAQVVRIVTDVQGEALGFVALNTAATGEDDRLLCVVCKNIVWATGGPAGIYADSVYPLGHVGSTGVALEAGARAKNLTEWQYGLASVAPRWNVSGTYMQVLPRFVSVDAEGNEYEFLSEYFTDLGECLSRVFRKGYEWPFDSRRARVGSSVIDLLVYRETKLRGRRVYLDFRRNPAGLDELPYDQLDEEARKYLENAGACFGTPIQRLDHMNRPAIELYASKGVDITKEMLEIALCAQHNNGGLDVDLWWQTDVPGLFAAGEAAGTHGVYRPGGSALNAGQVGSLRASQYIARNRAGLPDETAAKAIEHKVQAVATEVASLCHAMLASGEKSGDNTTALLAEHRADMSACAAAIRNVSAMKALIEKNRALLSSFDSRVAAVGSLGLARAFSLRDSLITQIAVLSSMIDYVEAGGRSRGSALYTAPDGQSAAGLENEADGLFRYLLDDGARDAVAQTLTYDAANMDCTAAWREVRPLPEGGGFFENVWRSYRENGNVY
jgi:succinate dehydrogenase/fumarate reductase flavoprotein subunit